LASQTDAFVSGGAMGNQVQAVHFFLTEPATLRAAL
jgi:hypothetical protein